MDIIAREDDWGGEVMEDYLDSEFFETPPKPKPKLHPHIHNVFMDILKKQKASSLTEHKFENEQKQQARKTDWVSMGITFADMPIEEFAVMSAFGTLDMYIQGFEPQKQLDKSHNL